MNEDALLKLVTVLLETQEKYAHTKGQLEAVRAILSVPQKYERSSTIKKLRELLGVKVMSEEDDE